MRLTATTLDDVKTNSGSWRAGPLNFRRIKLFLFTNFNVLLLGSVFQHCTYVYFIGFIEVFLFLVHFNLTRNHMEQDSKMQNQGNVEKDVQLATS